MLVSVYDLGASSPVPSENVKIERQSAKPVLFDRLKRGSNRTCVTASVYNSHKSIGSLLRLPALEPCT